MVSWGEFNARLERGLNYFLINRDLVVEYIDTYSTPKIIKASMAPGEPTCDWTIHADKEKHMFSISC